MSLTDVQGESINLHAPLLSIQQNLSLHETSVCIVDCPVSSVVIVVTGNFEIALVPL